MNHEPRHERVVSVIAQKIFSGALRPGDKLPTERDLAREMDLDRTSLRTALKRLESLRVIEIRPGDGIYVLDYTKNAGLDFLRLIFEQEKTEAGQPFVIDDFTIYEVWEFWASFFPSMLRFAAKRVSPRDIKFMLDLMEEEKRNLNDRDRVVELNILQEDLVAEATHNLVFKLSANASRPIRKKMVDYFVRSVDTPTLAMHVDLKQAFLSQYLSGDMGLDGLAEKYEAVLAAHLEALRKRHAGKDVAAMVEEYKTALNAGI
ncbi:MAG: GntR family transcriptional regulator [Thermodesulfobacteriota bacterium]